ncbi:uncharacterized protein LOC133744635 [Rosa rugosa]|uniref:uncharacterized protein LOC133744635 n=1 Tax=Rosa rugosa TaxID=74645 RepID=UPI002B411869|nr:uncharacterized protein LOC133744635 [Rosa rugosa]
MVIGKSPVISRNYLDLLWFQDSVTEKKKKMKNSGNGKSHKGNVREDQVKKDRKSGSDMNESPKKGGHGSKFTWADDLGYSTADMGFQKEVIDAKDPNFEDTVEIPSV